MAGRFSVEVIFKAVDKISGSVSKMSESVDKFVDGSRKKLKGLSDQLNIGGSFAALAGAATAGAVATGAAIHSIVGAGMEFEQAITNVGAVSLMTRDQIADLEKKALELGASTKFSATEVANAMEMMGRAGFTNAQTLDGIEGVLAAAAAEGAELADTASTISNVLKGMNLEASESGRVADVLTLASARTNSSITSLGESMKMLGPVAAQFNIPLEQAVGMAALLQDVGLDASSAGTSAASALTKLSKPTKRAQQQMTKFGISFKDANGNMKPATEIFGEMAKAVHKSGGNMEQAAFFAELVGLESQKAAINLTNAFMSGKAGALTQELEGAAGSAKKMADLRMQTLGGDVEQLTGALETLKINLFQTQGGPLRGMVQALTKWLEANQSLIRTKIGDFLSAVVSGVQTLGRVLDAAWPIAEAFARGVWAGVLSVRGWISSLESVIGPLEEVLGAKQSDRIKNAAALGSMIAKGAAAFFLVGTAIKAAQGALVLFELAQKAVTAAVWLGQVAVNAVRAAWVSYQIATKAGIGATIAMSLGQKALAVDLAATKVAAMAAASSIGAIAAAAGAAVAAIGAVYLANEDLKGATGGLGALDTIGEMWKRGTWDPFEAVDAYQNEKAKNAAMARDVETTGFKGVGLPDQVIANPNMVSPQDRAAAAVVEKKTTVAAEVTIKDKTGTAEVTKKPPPGSPVGLALKPSGSL